MSKYSRGCIAVLELTDSLTIQRLFAHHKEILYNDVLKWLAFTQRKTIRKFVAAHPNTEKKILVWLSSDEDMEVRSTVAKNPHTPAHVLLRLAEADYRPIRLAVVDNPNTPQRIVSRIREEDSLSHRKNILENWITLCSSYVKLGKALSVPRL